MLDAAASVPPLTAHHRSPLTTAHHRSPLTPSIARSCHHIASRPHKAAKPQTYTRFFTPLKPSLVGLLVQSCENCHIGYKHCVM
ncbi:hypothetical protein RRG08_035801 [Elysia crispata]|uniref:Uncharacterized protein n=1 Tax=Elysia crispata TaxID=231223 RepID=A0AAE1DJJ5_9GAST|nr:hypothetical protein RRG08_035801 [Elysia crispata]